LQSHAHNASYSELQASDSVFECPLAVYPVPAWIIYLFRLLNCTSAYCTVSSVLFLVMCVLMMMMTQIWSSFTRLSFCYESL